jgi:hypothetical protein
MKKTKKSIVLDFDGVIHSYTTKFRFPWIIPDPPVKGAMRFIHNAIQQFTVKVFSVRSANERGLKAMYNYIEKHGVAECGEDFKKTIKKVKFPVGRKPEATLFIDDRGFQFDGSFPSLEYINDFKPWNKKGE